MISIKRDIKINYYLRNDHHNLIEEDFEIFQADNYLIKQI
jgi:hypothetical protein